MVPKELMEAREAFQVAVEGAEEVLRAIRTDGRLCVETAESVVEALLAQLDVSDALVVRFLSTVSGPSSLAAEAVSTGILALRIGLELGYPRHELVRLGLAVLAYEGGRARVPTRNGDAGASKRGVEESAELLRRLGPAYADVADLVLRVHEGVNGSDAVATRDRGRGEHAQVIALATTYRSLARQRGAGGRSWPPAPLKELLQRQRARFADRLLKVLIRVLATLPVGGLVRLNSGEIGYVVAKNAGFPLRPVVAVWLSLGRQLAEPKLVDLRQSPFLSAEEFLGEVDLDEWVTP
jgi:hypothetical protein